MLDQSASDLGDGRQGDATWEYQAMLETLDQRPSLLLLAQETTKAELAAMADRKSVV